MRKFVLLTSLFMVLFCLQSSAQTSISAAVYSLPRTVLKVEIITKKTEITAGPYARYAQKYLGIIVPLSNKVNYSIESAIITPFEESDPQFVYRLDNISKEDRESLLRVTPSGIISKGTMPLVNECVVAKELLCQNEKNTSADDILQIDKRNVAELNQSEMAQNAAQTIFMLRRKRIELLTGELGENVFGEGLKVAMEELNRLEREYIALFAGKTVTTIERKTFELIPDQNNSMIVCRFSPTEGVVDASNLGGYPIVMEFKLEGDNSNSVAADVKGAKVYVRVAEMVNVNVVDSNNRKIISSKRLPIYQFGRVMAVPVSLAK